MSGPRTTKLKFDEHHLYGEIEQKIAAVNEDAVRFLRAYNIYCGRIDDIIDEELYRNDPEFILETFVLGTELTSGNFYSYYRQLLLPQIHVITSIYADSIKLERSGNPNKERVADTLRHCGLNMLFFVMSIVLGYESLRCYGTDLWDFAWDLHHDKDGNPH